MLEKDFKSLGFGFKHHSATGYDKVGKINCYISRHTGRPDIFLYHHIDVGSFNLSYNRKQWSNNNMIARDFKVETIEELNEFLSVFNCFTN